MFLSFILLITGYGFWKSLMQQIGRASCLLELIIVTNIWVAALRVCLETLWKKGQTFQLQSRVPNWLQQCTQWNHFTSTYASTYPAHQLSNSGQTYLCRLFFYLTTISLQIGFETSFLRATNKISLFTFISSVCAWDTSCEWPRTGTHVLKVHVAQKIMWLHNSN